jgi:uncharacterized protein DUF6314
LWSVADLREFLFGSWKVDRSLLDRRHSIRGNLHGHADFVPAGCCLLYEERGTLTFGAHCGAAEQSYKYDFGGGNARACVSFRDGRAFHDLDLSHGQTLVSHVCGHDLYEGRFIALDPGQWQSVWKVAGPRKDLEIFTLYSRLC